MNTINSILIVIFIYLISHFVLTGSFIDSNLTYTQKTELFTFAIFFYSLPKMAEFAVQYFQK